jgi:hypothetical protein
MRRGWDRFWFASVPYGDLAVLRIAWATALFAHIALGDLADWISRFEGPHAQDYRPIPLLRLLALPLGGAGAIDHQKLEIALVSTQVAGALAVLGLRTRAALLAFALGSLLLQSWVYSVQDLTHHVALLQWGVLLLAFSPCGAVLSLDARLGRGLRRPAPGDLAEGAGWPVRTVHALLALAYLSAGASKVLRGPEDWFGGWTLHFYVAFQAARTGSAAGAWLSGHHGLITAIAWAVVAFEIGFVLSLFQRRGLWIWAVACTLIHAGAAGFMEVYFTSFPVLSGCLVRWTDLARGLVLRARRGDRAVT